MPFLEILLLSLVQALTEFLPISSSAHLYLASKAFGEVYQGITFDLGLHLGTLVAVLIYFRADWRIFFNGAVAYAQKPSTFADLTPPQRQLFGIVVASIPVAAIGYAMSQTPGLVDSLRNDTLIGINLIICSVLMLLAQIYGSGNRDISSLSVRLMLLIGLTEALALMPGVSRSGITITVALLIGLPREQAARFSFLLAVPATAMAVGKGLIDMIRSTEALSWGDFLLGALLSGLFGLIVIHYFMALIKKIGLMPFIIYRIALGTVLLLGIW
jgi:undecaprenyl-diphosphatase